MTILRHRWTDSAPPAFQGAAIAIGNFDGVHRGHHRLLARLRDRARRLGVPALALVLHPHPAVLLRPSVAPAPLQDPERRAELLLRAGADRVLILETEPSLLALSAEEFFSEVLVRRLAARGVVEGANFAFGKDRKGTVVALEAMCRAAGIDCEIVPLAGGDFAVSSSRIRAALHDGDLAFVRRWLGRPHRVRGVVARGAARGRTIGFPTANLSGVVAALPADGVYAVRALLPSGEIKGGAANLGPNPTFQAGERKFEVHLFDFAGDLYDAALDVEFLARLRGVRQFSGVAALVAQIAEDCERARVVLAAEPAPAPGEDLARTIEEWTRHEVAEHLAPLDGEFLAATFIDAERLALRFRLPDVLPPPTRHELDFALPDRLRRAFPEIRDVEIAADR